MKNSFAQQGGTTTAPAVYRRRQREQLARMAAGAEVPNARRDHPTSAPSERKQPGRRYGPGPMATATSGQAPAPMSTGRRFAAYTAATLLTTRRQERQLYRMGLRHDDLWSARRKDAKGRPTPTPRELS